VVAVAVAIVESAADVAVAVAGAEFAPDSDPVVAVDDTAGVVVVVVVVVVAAAAVVVVVHRVFADAFSVAVVAVHEDIPGKF